jgi:hypothetical protein
MEGRLMQLQLCSIHFPTFPKRLTGHFLRQHLQFASSGQSVAPLLLKLCRAALVTVLPTVSVCDSAAQQLASDIMVRAQQGGCLLNSAHRLSKRADEGKSGLLSEPSEERPQLIGEQALDSS